MSLYIASLNSGSNGNCYYIGNKQEAVLIDAGISCRETEKRMKRLGLSMELVKAVFVSHEHSDHNECKTGNTHAGVWFWFSQPPGDGEICWLRFSKCHWNG